jgi:pilus assembly protein Flp/PilA
MSLQQRPHRGLTFAQRLLRDERGATAIEYALILAFIFLAMIAALGGVAGSTNRMWTDVSATVSGITNPPPKAAPAPTT